MALVLLPFAVLLAASPERTINQTLTVFAAASLKDAFTSVSKRFEAKHPGVSVALNFAGSQTLAAQILHGAPADVFASASRKNLDDAKVIANSVRVFARNRLTIVVRTGLSGVNSPKRLSQAARIVLADKSVPAGMYTDEFLAKGAKRYGDTWRRAVVAHIVSREADVRSVLAKVVLGEADAGIVYQSDAVAAKSRVRVVPIPNDLNVVAEYPVGIVSRTNNHRLAQGFIDHLFNLESQKTLVHNGFLSPTGRTGMVKKGKAKPE